MIGLFKDRGNPGIRRLVLGILSNAEKEMESLVETREPSSRLAKYHPQKLGEEEAAILGRAFLRIVQAKEKLEVNSHLQDVPVSDICTCESVLRLLSKEGVLTIFGMWKHDPGDLKRILEWSKPMGGRNELYLYLFVNEE